MPHPRWRIVTALSGIALFATLGLGASAPAQAEPDIDDVQARVDRLFHEAEQASERLHDAELELTELKRDLGSLSADQQRQDASLDAARDELQDSIVSQYQGQSLAAVGQVIVSDDPSGFLSGLSTMSAYQGVQAQLFDAYATEAKALDIRADATADRLAEIKRTEALLAKEKAEIEAKHSEAEALLDRLKEEERAALLSRGSIRLPSGVETSGRAAAALEYAMAQVGDSYVYGAAGPNAFDCSGLTMMAWAQAGVGLPHSSSAQYGVGRHVSSKELQPGDLVFYYSPISHVAMYIGNGLIVEAANPGAGVRVSGVFSMPYAGATRLI